MSEHRPNSQPIHVPRSLAERTEAMFRSVDPTGQLAVEWKQALQQSSGPSDCPLCGASPETAKHCPPEVKCPVRWEGDDGTAKQCIERRHCGCDEAFKLAANQCLHGIQGDEFGHAYCPRIKELEAELAAPVELPNPIWMARFFHETYERLAPQYGYETRPETREFSHESANGRLMAAVCEEFRKVVSAQPEAGPGGALTLEFADQIFGSFIRASGGEFHCVHCEKEIDPGGWIWAEHASDCVVNSARAYLKQHKPEAVPDATDCDGGKP